MVWIAVDPAEALEILFAVFCMYVELDSGCVFVEMQEEPKESPAEATSDPGLGRGGQEAEVGRFRSRVRSTCV